MEQTRVLGKRILLVEDECGVRDCIKRLLSIDSHAVTEAANGAEAVKLFRRLQFDVVITDFDMPKMAGDELVATIRRDAPDQPILMITACSERLTGQGNCANAILEKPFGITELRQTLAAVLS